jgi:hypothetical protein
MTISKLEKTKWQAYFDRVSKILEGQRAEVEAASLRLGDQVEAEWLPLSRITYDSAGNAIKLTLDGRDHAIQKPQDVFVDQEAVLLTSMEVIDSDDVRRIIRLRDPMMLPKP